MKIEVLVTTMHQSDISKYTEMNLQTDVVLANQADRCDFEETEINGNNVRFVTTDTTGASLNRNIALTYSKGDILIFSDDDQVFVDGYEQIIENAFNENPDADAIKFYCESTNKERPMSYKGVKETIKASKRKIMSAGVHALAVRKAFLEKNDIWFDNRIGPGQKIYCGEDSVFLNTLLKCKAKFYLSPVFLSYINQGESSWFKGYDEQFCISVGYIYSLIYGSLAPLAAFRRSLRESRKKNCELTLKQLFFTMLKGIKKQRKRGK